MFLEVPILTIMVIVMVTFIVRDTVFQRDLVCSRGFLKFLFSCKWI